MTETKTVDCSKVWNLISKVDGIDQKLFNDLSDAFTDFECAWKEHADEFYKVTTRNPDTVQHILMVEVAHVVTGGELHELLCKVIHEQEPNALNDLRATVYDIQVVGQIDKT